jgi:hypothetical protein
MFHEADLSNISEGIKKGEGMIMHYSRYFYRVYLFLLLFGAIELAYTYTRKTYDYYEDYLDEVFFQNFKRGRSNSYLINITYYFNSINISN